MANYDTQTEKPVADEGAYANVSGTIAVWLILLFAALVIQYAFTYANSALGATPTIFLSISNFILFLPGSLILPLIVGAALGAEIGTKSRSRVVAEKAGLVNGIYASLVYLVAIVVIYEVLANILPAIAPTMYFLLVNWVISPIAIVLVATEIFSVVSHYRKINA